jgi:hypothetical protein
VTGETADPDCFRFIQVDGAAQNGSISRYGSVDSDPAGTPDSVSGTLCRLPLKLSNRANVAGRGTRTELKPP